MQVMDTNYERGYETRQEANFFSCSNFIMDFFLVLVEDKCIKYILT